MNTNEMTRNGNISMGGKSAGARLGLLALFCCAFVAAFLPVITGLVQAWSGSEDYSHGFLIAPLSAFILWQKREIFSRPGSAGSLGGLVLVVLSLAVYLFAHVAGIATLAALSMVAFLWGTVVYLFGFRVYCQALFPLTLLLFMIPIPAQIYAALTIPLQLIVSKLAVGMAAATGIPVYREGNVIHLARGTFEVVQACSGLRSIMALLTIGAVLGYFSLTSNFLRAILFATGIPIAVAVNILRVFVLIVAFHYLNIDLAEGTAHTVLGLALFVVSFGLFLLIRKGLSLCDR